MNPCYQLIEFFVKFEFKRVGLTDKGSPTTELTEP